ncbi:MAG: hypothetical protein OHK0024_10140 [Thalassobaculales bacterium]
MKTVTTAELQRDPRAVLAEAAAGPVVIEEAGLPVAFVLDAGLHTGDREERMERFRRLVAELGARAERRGMTDQALAELLSEDE